MRSEKQTLASIIAQIVALAAFAGKRYDLICALGAISAQINLLIKRLEQGDQRKNF